jgi:hypothetical protein
VKDSARCSIDGAGRGYYTGSAGVASCVAAPDGRATDALGAGGGVVGSRLVLRHGGEACWSDRPWRVVAASITRQIKHAME